MIRRTFAAVLSCAAVFLTSAAASARPHGSILVVGGTPAGVAAAVAAAREGQDVTLVAGRPVLGGILTDAMMDQWDLNVAPDGATIEGGLFGEIHAALGDAFTPASAAGLFARMTSAEPRIEVVTGAHPVAVQTADGEGGRSVRGVSFARSDGSTFERAAQTIVDATDNGDVAAMAGARFDLGRQDTGIDERMQPVTLMFTLRGVAWPSVVAAYDAQRYGNGGANDRRAWGYATILREYRPLSSEIVVRDLNLGREPDGTVTVNAVDVLGIDGRSAIDLARARALSERETPHLIAFLREHLDGFGDATLGRYAQVVYVRETRHFAGLERLTAGDVWNGTVPDDTIGLSSYPLDLHPVTATDRLAYAPIRHVYGVPFGALVPRGLANLVLASPAISATHLAAGSARVIPTTIEEGEAAGDAAAFAAQHHLSIAALARDPSAVAALRDELRSDGGILSYSPATSAEAALDERAAAAPARNSGSTRDRGKL